jgi:hypothetical protein
MRAIRTSGLMSGDGKRGSASALVLAPILDSTNLIALVPFWRHFTDKPTTTIAGPGNHFDG